MTQKHPRRNHDISVPKSGKLNKRIDKPEENSHGKSEYNLKDNGKGTDSNKMKF
jgi:hypothetical protein